ncbi:MAG: gfo/Idh/MocA family oxidoreductase [Tardiphaga sp.]|uniref:Gfo/Idh/MocA family protein n=1 Tax=Tardiphaga sp. TaxID=1926292 RepID=UPI002630D25D|nr:Gfo/Idh/MocA family oxidoreductase [Tardiphaga sp.]MDB5502761.1 gfo/Idh/MocA family oxidoreductase [Tardiphaga sp.]
MINTAIVGLGRWGRNLVEAAAGHGRLHICSAVEPVMDGARDFCAAHGLSLFDELGTVLADNTIAAVLLATPHSLHPAQVKACAAAGKAIFCEKPLALHRADAAAMFDACRRAGVPLAVGHNRRFWPAMRALREMVASCELGTLLHIEGHNSNENSQNVTAGWRLSPEESPGGGLTGAGLHVLDAFVSLLGPVRTVHTTFTSRAPGPPPLDTTLMMLEFANGVTGTLATVRATPLFWRVHIFGTQGSAEVLDETTLVLRRSGQPPEVRALPRIDVLPAELDAFADMVEVGLPFPVPEADVLATLSAFEAGLKSIELGVTVSCDNQDSKIP